MSDTELQKALEIAWRFIEYAPRTEYEVRQRLSRAEFDDAVVEAVMENVRRSGLVDDVRYACDWVEERAGLRCIGRTRILNELAKKGISREVAEEAVETLPLEVEVDAAQYAARKHCAGRDLTDYRERGRLSAFLKRRGYNWDVVQQVIAALLANEQ